MVKRRLKNLINLGSFSNYKKLPTYKKSSSKEADLERNMLASLESVPLESMKKLVN
jgi:hypothetical protein